MAKFNYGMFEFGTFMMVQLYDDKDKLESGWVKVAGNEKIRGLRAKDL